MDKANLCQKILEAKGNQHTKIVVTENEGGSYYSYINDTIYLGHGKSHDEAKNIVVLSHECIHSIQSKTLHILNIFFSNVEIVVFLVTMICFILNKASISLFILYLIINLLSIVFRCLLEIPAMKNSFNMAKTYCSGKTRDMVEDKQRKLNRFMAFGILSFTWFRLIRMLVAIVCIYIL